MKSVDEPSNLQEARSSGSIVRFGVFEADLEAEELRKNGIKLKLPHQQFQLLALLLEQPGRVVTREDLRHRLWPEDTFVNFDRCLNTAVNKLREVICDSADNPRFIQTLPRRGYRFLAPTEIIERTLRPSAQTSRPAAAEAEGAAGTRWIWIAGGALLAVVAAATWFQLRQEAGNPRITKLVRLTRSYGARTTPSFSPDGEKVIFSWSGERGDNYDIYSLEIGSTTPVRLTTSPAEDFAPVYSPDGRRIAFYRRSGQLAFIYMIPSPGERAFRLTRLNIAPPGPSSSVVGVQYAERLSWSPDGSSLALVDNLTPTSPPSLYVHSFEAGHRRRVTWPPEDSAGDGYPAFSPDGLSLAFVRKRTSVASDIYVTTLAGGEPRQLTSIGKRVYGLTWTPDSKHIVFSLDHAGGANLWRVPAAGGRPERLTASGEGAFLPAVSPAGNRLAYVRWAGASRLSRVRLDGAVGGDAPEVVPIKIVGSGQNPQFSRDGRRIVFSGSAGDGVTQVWVSDVENLNPFRLTATLSNSASPRWSPNGDRIAFDSLVERNYEIFVIRSDGGEPLRLTHYSGEDIRPDWSADGEWIYFSSDRSGAMQVWKMPADGGNAIQLTTNGGYESAPSPDGKFVYFVKGGAPGIWRVPVEGGEETLVTEALQWEHSRNWQVTAKGIYFLASEGDTLSDRRSFVRLYHFDTRSVATVASLGGGIPLNSGCSVSPDGRSLLYVLRDEVQTELMMVENFH